MAGDSFALDNSNALTADDLLSGAGALDNLLFNPSGSGSSNAGSILDNPTPNESLFNETIFGESFFEEPQTVAQATTLPVPLGSEGTQNLQYSIAQTELRTGTTNPGPIPLDSRFSTVSDENYFGPRDPGPADGNGYTFNEIDSDPVGNADAFEPIVDYNGGIKDIAPGQPGETIQNGTFFHGADLNPTGAIFADGKFATKPTTGEELSGSVDGINRGGVAQLSDGRIVINTAFGNDIDAINARYAGDDPNAQVVDFIGGGAQIIGTSVPLGDSTLNGGQNFSGGINAPQFDDTNHSLIGIRDGKAYSIGAEGKSGQELVDELTDMGFTSVVKLDGGRTSYYNTGDAAPEISGRGVGADDPHFYGIRTLGTD